MHRSINVSHPTAITCSSLRVPVCSLVCLVCQCTERVPDVQITDGKSTVKVSNGDAMMTKITAGGCSVTAVACAFITAAPEQPLLATAFALAVFG